MTDETRRESVGAVPPTTREERPVPGTRHEAVPDGERQHRTGSTGATSRESQAAYSTQHESAAEGGSDSNRGLMRLPSALASRYRIVREIPTAGNEADLFLIEDTAEKPWVAKIYRPSISPKTEVLARVSQAAPEHVIRLVEHGAANSPGSGGRAWEVLEYAASGSLRDLLDREDLRADFATVKQILKELNEAIGCLHAMGIEHRDLKPDNILVRTRTPLDLVLIDFGIASIVDASHHFSQRSSRTLHYAPPESGSGVVFKTKWDYWSLGIILVETISGRNVFGGLTEQQVMSWLATRPVDDFVVGVSDPKWRLLLRGLLRRDPKNRWGKAEIDRWLRNPDDPKLAVAEESDTTSARKGFLFKGKSLHSREELAEAFAADWSYSVDVWKRRSAELQDWLKDSLGLTELASQLLKISQTRTFDLDGQVFNVISVLDPKRPPIFKGHALNATALASLAERAQSEPASGDLLRSLYRNHILVTASSLPEHGDLKPVLAAWQDTLVGYAGLLQRFATVDGVATQLPNPDNDPACLIELLAASTPGSGVIGTLRKAALQAASADARRCSWFRGLGDPRSAAAHVAAVLPRLAANAEAQVRTARAAREVHIARNSRFMFVGGLIGGLIAALFWGGTTIFCSYNIAVCRPKGWPYLPVELWHMAAIGGIMILWAVSIFGAARLFVSENH